MSLSKTLHPLLCTGSNQEYLSIHTVHSRYLGSKKPLGGLYHYINIGSFFLMLLDKYGIKLYIRDDFLINLCGVEDSVENYQPYFISFCAVMVSYGILFFSFFFSFCHSYFDLSHDFHAELCFHSHFIFTAHTSFCCINV